jgi:hypothetical protein
MPHALFAQVWENEWEEALCNLVPDFTAEAMFIQIL